MAWKQINPNMVHTFEELNRFVGPDFSLSEVNKFTNAFNRLFLINGRLCVLIDSVNDNNGNFINAKMWIIGDSFDQFPSSVRGKRQVVYIPRKEEIYLSHLMDEELLDESVWEVEDERW
jgi:hypothetical protein